MSKGGDEVNTDAIERAAAKARALQKQTYEKNLELSQPFYDTGVDSMGRLSDLLGLSQDVAPEEMGSLTERFTLDKFEEDPGYQYRQDEAQQALERSMAAQGVTLGGGGLGNINPQVAKALMEQSQGMASQEYQSAYNRYVNDQLNQYNMYSGMTNLGVTGLGSMTGAGNQYATNVGNIETGLASALTNAQMANQSSANSTGSMFGTLLGGAAGAYFGGPSGAMAGANIGSRS